MLFQAFSYPAHGTSLYVVNMRIECSGASVCTPTCEIRFTRRKMLHQQGNATVTQTSLTINKHYGLLDSVLVAELGVQQSPTHGGTVVRGPVPAVDVQMVDVDVAETPYHLHLLLN